MICNRNTLLELAPIKYMLDKKVHEHGVSHGLSEAGYDIRIKQSIHFHPNGWSHMDQTPWVASKDFSNQIGTLNPGRFTIASAIEEFDMPNNLVGIVHDKSSWARKGLSVFNTVIEPGWKGFLTLELVYHGSTDLIIPAGAGIAQVVFHQATDTSEYTGRYQNQENKPIHAIES